MGCGCNSQNLAHRKPISDDYYGDPGYPNEEPYLFDLSRGPVSPDILDPLAFQGRDEQGNLIPFIMNGYPVNPSGCQFDGRELKNYGPMDYPSWIL